MKNLFLLLTFISFNCFGQSEEDFIRKTLTNYLEGSAYNDPEKIVSAFYEDANLYLSKENQEIWTLKPREYASLFEMATKGEFNGRESSILSIDTQDNIAMAKAEINIKARNARYVDLFLLKKLSGEWKIISKVATLLPNP